MAASSRLMITEAERRFPMRVWVAVPPAGFGERLNRMHAWLDDNCGADGWEITVPWRVCEPLGGLPTRPRLAAERRMVRSPGAPGDLKRLSTQNSATTQHLLHVVDCFTHGKW
jgi:hypothetical protein